MANSSSSINLAGNAKQDSLFDKIINWTLTVGRLIVIVTEILAISAFIYRISLDRKLEDLQSQIDQRQTLVASLKKDEDRYRNLQDRIALASKFSTSSEKTNKLISDIVSFVPATISISDMSVEKDKITMSLSVIETSSLNDFITPLKNYPEISSVSIDNIENRPSNGLLVDITATLK